MDVAYLEHKERNDQAWLNLANRCDGEDCTEDLRYSVRYLQMLFKMQRF